MNIEEDINILKQLIREYKRKTETQNEFFIGLIEERALESLLTAYEEKCKELKKEIKDDLDVRNRWGLTLQELEKEKEKNEELSNSYDKLAKECNEENRRCMLLAVENQDLKEKNKELNILRLELLISQFPDTTETYKKYKKELEKLLKEE